MKHAWLQVSKTLAILLLLARKDGAGEWRVGRERQKTLTKLFKRGNDRVKQKSTLVFQTGGKKTKPKN